MSKIQYEKPLRERFRQANGDTRKKTMRKCDCGHEIADFLLTKFCPGCGKDWRFIDSWWLFCIVMISGFTGLMVLWAMLAG